MGISVDLVTTDQQAPLGFIHTVPASKGAFGSGEQEWIYIQADPASPAPLNPGEMVSFGSGPGTVVPASAAIHPFGILGVAQHTILPGEYGFVLKSGLGLILADGAGLSALTAFVCGANAPAATDAASAADAAVGLALGAGVAAGTLGDVFIKL
jgi:hypothetical protein